MTTNIKNHNALRSMNNKTRMLSLASMVFIGLLTTSQVYAQRSAHLGLYEDQALICLKNTNEQSKDFGIEICKVVQILDLLNENQEQQLRDEFGTNYDNDTFDIESLD